MSSMTYFIIAAAAAFGLIGSAMAAEMSGAEIKDLISGKSVYLELTAAPGARPKAWSPERLAQGTE